MRPRLLQPEAIIQRARRNKLLQLAHSLVLLSTTLLIVMAIHFMRILGQGSAAWAGWVGAVLAVLGASMSFHQRNSLLRLSLVSGLIIGTFHAVTYHWLISSVLGGYPVTAVYQYIASAALGEAAFAGGIAAALLGVLFHFIISLIVTGVLS